MSSDPFSGNQPNGSNGTHPKNPKTNGTVQIDTRYSPQSPTNGIISPNGTPKKVYRSADSPHGHQHIVYKIVLTGGPCGGKTTAQERLATFFEGLGWKVYTVPETATILQSGRVKFSELTEDQAYAFQKDIVDTMLKIEETFFNQANLMMNKNVLVVCDRGIMDPSAYMPADGWQRLLNELDLKQFDLLNKRYDQVVHLVTAADGAESFYTLANNATRTEGLEAARALDEVTRKVWLGHPHFDIVDNSDTNKFEEKVLKLVQVVADRIGLETKDRLSKNSRKRKWLVVAVDELRFVKDEKFTILHDYLNTDSSKIQVRIRSRAQGKNCTYTFTRREYHPSKESSVETSMQIQKREYEQYLTMRDASRCQLRKLRRCFMFGNQYFHLDIYQDHLPSQSLEDRPVMILETYTTIPKGTPLPRMPEFLTIEKEITGELAYSMYNMSKLENPPDDVHEQANFVGEREFRDD
ncbi:hypothetical protein WR25_17596 [Diploscapter pachys]|uniref:NadR/Ttd14 AAA domain-containing protein n=1 Tax=Diploscapter pachys TaxID=2018661 RepID=A0A2A2JB32_9BILA|nr:hypothetical protein WR25_17596 [Diploscapter pachys]